MIKLLTSLLKESDAVMPVFEVGPIDQNIIYAFLAGFILAFIILLIRILVIKSRSRREIKELRLSLTNRIELEASSINGYKKEIEALQKKNDNLNLSIQNLSSKVGRREKLQLRVYQSAIEKMSVRAPGFAPAWHIVLKECEDELGRSLDGTIPFTNRVVSSVGTGWADSSLSTDSSTDDFASSGIEIESEKGSEKQKANLPSKIKSFFSR
ncbi:MAG: hypothetical protein PQJ46_10370 [Spirochaetales bacterium]|nr:hypothetical protein [Spirochaetales bacterium]